MTVNPGFGGQSFIYETLPKIQQARRGARGAFAYKIGVDGGVDFKTAADCARAGATVFISGTALFGRPNLRRRAASELVRPSEGLRSVPVAR